MIAVVASADFQRRRHGADQLDIVQQRPRRSDVEAQHSTWRVTHRTARISRIRLNQPATALRRPMHLARDAVVENGEVPPLTRHLAVDRAAHQRRRINLDDIVLAVGGKRDILLVARIVSKRGPAGPEITDDPQP